MKSTAFKILICLFVCAAAGSILITIANYLPIRQEYQIESLQQLEQEGLFPEVPGLVKTDGNFHSDHPGALELATDALMVKMALYDGEGAGIHQAFYAYSTQYEAEYSRYWHGYVVLLRPLLYFFTYWDLRIINGIMQSLLVLLVALLIGKRRGIRYALAVFSSYLLLMPMALAYCLQYSWMFYVSFGALLLFLAGPEQWLAHQRVLILFTLTGCMTIYLDLMTYPLLSWGLLAAWVLVFTKEERALTHIAQLIQSAFAWLFGYLGMWVMKWVIGSIVLRQNLFARALLEVELWLFNGSEEGLSVAERLKVLYENISTYSYRVYVVILLCWMLYLGYRMLRYGCRATAKGPALLLITCSSLVWYTVMASHSQQHHIFTHRAFGVSIAAAVLFLLVLTEQGTEDTWRIRLRKGEVGILVVSLLLGYGSMMLLREERLSVNWEQNFECMELKDGTVEVTLVPTAGRIHQLALGLENSSAQGVYHVELLQGDEVCQQIDIPIASYEGEHFLWVDTDWKVHASEAYLLRVETVDATETTQLWYTTETGSLAELSGLRANDTTYQAAPLLGICYLDRIRGGAEITLFWILYAVLFLEIIYSAYALFSVRSLQTRA